MFVLRGEHISDSSVVVFLWIALCWCFVLSDRRSGFIVFFIWLSGISLIDEWRILSGMLFIMGFLRRLWQIVTVVFYLWFFSSCFKRFLLLVFLFLFFIGSNFAILSLSFWEVWFQVRLSLFEWSFSPKRSETKLLITHF